MEYISIIYIVGAVIAISASIPQVIKLLRTKRSDEFQLSTWVTWSATQATSLLYVISLGNTHMIATNIAWVSFYAVMAYLIYRYRSPAQLDEPVESSSRFVDETVS